jgi:transcriptional regulator with XRE-family HTH domain
LAKRLAEWQTVGVDETIDRALDAVGPRLKRLRLRRETTLTALAEQTGISASTLSRLEAGLRRPTLEQLLPLARAYGVTLDELVDAPPTGDPRINLRPIVCQDGSTILPLTRRAGGIQAYKFVLPTGNDDEEPSLRTHEALPLIGNRGRSSCGRRRAHGRQCGCDGSAGQVLISGEE